jgi:hypothetical protein
VPTSSGAALHVHVMFPVVLRATSGMGFPGAPGGVVSDVVPEYSHVPFQPASFISKSVVDQSFNPIIFLSHPLNVAPAASFRLAVR